jgi:CRISPR/Cas system-associated exonuclease Cas4 (RecB family)
MVRPFPSSVASIPPGPRTPRVPGFPLYFIIVSDLLSKSHFAAGLQCPKLLWWKAHEPDAPELVPDAAARFIRDEGARVGEAARACFPGGVLIDLPHDQVQERLEATRRALDRGEPAIFEATFAQDGVVVSVDILARKGRTHVLIEVKSSTSIKTHHLWDVALQAYVLRRAGVEVDTVEIMHLNDGCRFPQLEDLFVREAVSGRVRALFPQISKLVRAQAAMLEGPLPEFDVGRHCDQPHPCPFRSRCWPALPRHSVETFYALRRDKSAQLGAQGLERVDEVPASFPLNTIQQRQRRSVTAGELRVEGDLAGALAPFQGRVAYLDFETVGPAIPVWEGFGPWHHHPVQFSCHIASPDGGLEHVEWLAEGPDDCRAALAQTLVDALEDVDAVVAYNAPFERKCLEVIAAAAPEQAPRIHTVASKLRDLLPVVRDHVYHPDFLGSFSLKSVVPALLPDLSHESLEVSKGHTASALLHRLLFLGEPRDPAQREALRRSLLDYCAMDTLALARLKEQLDELAGIRLGESRP